MNIQVVESTDDAEKVMCIAARGDYMSEWNAEKSFEEIMSTVSYNDDNMKRAKENNFYPDESDETEARMISFIEKQMSRGHYGIAEHPQITFTVEGVSRVTMAQITRHRHMTFDVQSQRYVDFSEQEITTPKSLVDESLNRETGISEVDRMDEIREKYESTVDDLVDFYEEMVENGVPKEDARFILPLGTTVNMTFSGNARTFLHVLNLRSKASSQWQIRDLSEMIIDELMDWMPYTYSWYDRNRPHKIGP